MSETPRTFQGWVRYDDKFEMKTLRLNPIRPKDVVIRNLAAQACYTIVTNVSELPNQAVRPRSPGHGAMGVVEEVGPLVTRVKPGDKVVTPVLPACGTCYSCLRGEWWCCGHKNDIDFAHPDNPPFAEMEDGRAVWQDHTGGFAELAVNDESWVVPVNESRLSNIELASLACVPGPGWAFGLLGMRIEIASSVVVLGAGPLGLAIIQAARMAGARLIIAVERIPHRLEAAKAAGAHVVLDSDEVGMDNLVGKVRELCRPATDNMYAGGKPYEGFYDGNGADHVFEAAGITFGDPTTGSPDDRTGAHFITLGPKMTRRGGTFVATGVVAPTNDPKVWGPAPGPFDYHGKRYLSAAYGGANVLRDIPRLANLIENGYLDAKALCDPILPFERADEALWSALNRDALLPIITFE
ncbi:alcohol dehydrogenase catalytic domain-containing protein [Microbispora bryophytorum]|uniref:alcohol dehydrogenase catalytic domain-containing protein n=1 Tax=Microbispora bryophytorum TaxID=1460882 RepID=UPI0033C940BC